MGILPQVIDTIGSPWCNVWGGTVLVASYWWLHLLVVNGPTAPAHDVWLRWVDMAGAYRPGGFTSAQSTRPALASAFCALCFSHADRQLLAASLREGGNPLHRPGLVRLVGRLHYKWRWERLPME